MTVQVWVLAAGRAALSLPIGLLLLRAAVAAQPRVLGPPQQQPRAAAAGGHAGQVTGDQSQAAAATLTSYWLQPAELRPRRAAAVPVQPPQAQRGLRRHGAERGEDHPPAPGRGHALDAETSHTQGRQLHNLVTSDL